VATGIDRKLIPHVIAPFPCPPQVTDSTRTTLSRWRHGFEPRWDYQDKRRSGALSGCGGPIWLVLVPHFVPRRFSHYQYDRGITLREAARLQSSRRVRPSSAPGCTPDWERASAADGSRFFAMQIGRALGSAVAEMPFSEELVVGAITVLGKAGVSNFAAGVSLRRRGSEKPADEQGSCLAYGTPEQPRGCAFERMRRLGNRGQ
jgi:hypothetical protein